MIKCITLKKHISFGMEGICRWRLHIFILKITFYTPCLVLDGEKLTCIHFMNTLHTHSSSTVLIMTEVNDRVVFPFSVSCGMWNKPSRSMSSVVMTTRCSQCRGARMEVCSPRHVKTKSYASSTQGWRGSQR